MDYIDWNVTQYDSDKSLPERLVTEVGIINTVDGYTRSKVLPTRRNEAAQNDSSPSSSRKGPQSHRLTSEPVLTNVRPSFRKRPNVIAVETRKTAGVPTARPVDIVPMPHVMVYENRCNGTVSGEVFPEEPDVGSAKIAEEANTGGATNEQHLHDDQNFKKTTITKLPTDFVEIPKVSVRVAEEASTNGATNVQCLYEDQNYKKTTITKLPMDFLEIPQPSFTRGFLELAEEARNGCVESEQWFLVDEVQPQVTGMTKPVIEPVSRLLEEELGQFVEVTQEAPSGVAPVKYEAGHMMQWADIKSDGVMLDGIMLESEMSPVSSVRGAAEPLGSYV